VLLVNDHDVTRELYAWCMRAAGWLVEVAAVVEIASSLVKIHVSPSREA
jgi:hypothetical protein